jgi:hypothetical protein
MRSRVVGGKEYRAVIEAAFDGTQVRLSFPFAGLPIGNAMAATKLATPGDLSHLLRILIVSPEARPHRWQAQSRRRF